jgi:DNA-directed RNA polymerase specialized sigma54-like protein
MVLTPQLRQRIEMLQMTSLELSELIEQELVANPVLEEVQPGDEVQEISDNILDQNADGQEERPDTEPLVAFESINEGIADNGRRCRIVLGRRSN